MTRDEAEADPTSHTITRWLGADSIDADQRARVAATSTPPGWLVVCSDGLWNYAVRRPTRCGELIAADRRRRRRPRPLDVADALVACANEQGGHDNITAALARCDPSLR